MYDNDTWVGYAEPEFFVTIQQVKQKIFFDEANSSGLVY